MELNELYTLWGKRLSAQHLERRSINPYQFDVISLHNHTDLSPCALTSIDELILSAKHHGLARIAITDHNKMKKTKEASSKSKKIIIGMEAKTQYSEISLLGLDTKISLVEKNEYDFNSIVCYAILRNQGLELKDRILVGLNHPFSSTIIGKSLLKKQRGGFNFSKYLHDNLKEADEAEINEYLDKYLLTDYFPEKFSKHEEILKELMSNFDYVEFNTFTYRHSDNIKAMRLAAKYNKPVLVGEDTHFTWQIHKSGFVIIPVEQTLSESLDKGTYMSVLKKQFNGKNPEKIDLIVLANRCLSGILKAYRG